MDITILTVLPPERYRPAAWDVQRGLHTAYASLLGLESSWGWLVCGDIPECPDALWEGDPRVQLLAGTGGIAQSLNTGLDAAVGELLLLLDSASTILPGQQQLIRELQQQPSAAYAFGQTVDWDCDQRVEIRVQMRPSPGMMAIGDVANYWNVHHAWWFVPESATWRTDVLRGVGGWPALADGAVIVPLVLASLTHPVWASNVEVYRLTRFATQPLRSVDRDRKYTTTHRHIRAQLAYRTAHFS